MGDGITDNRNPDRDDDHLCFLGKKTSESEQRLIDANHKLVRRQDMAIAELQGAKAFSGAALVRRIDEAIKILKGEV